ncbi:MAG: terpene cyclase/mutase family protein, partial [Oscillospiraceae bacterium]|nr:terpene cyclase/mutase family protein [Oscillospiraceae bacterium]
MKKLRLTAILLVLFQVICILPFSAFAEDPHPDTPLSVIVDNAVGKSLSYLENAQNEYGAWGDRGKLQTADIADILEYIGDIYQEEASIQTLITNAGNYIYVETNFNVDDFSRCFLIDEIRNDWYIDWLLSYQNPDGGFGLAAGYASDVIDTKLALKALCDLGETEAMLQAACWLALQQNGDGGFSYQHGVPSDPELTAEIADIFAECAAADAYISYLLPDVFSRLGEYLDAYAVPISELSGDSLSAVRQHFYMALFKLKTTGRYDISGYFELQDSNGGIFDDPMSTALFLELIVREQNSVIAGIEHILITNDRGYSVSAFTADENVNIEIGSEYETEKAELSVTLETPGGSIINIDPENPVWNTGGSEEGTYTVRADIIRKSNDAVIVSMMQTFRIEHRLAVDGVSLSLSQGFARVGDDADVGVSADVNIKNFSEETDTLTVRWAVKLDGESVFTADKVLTEQDLAEDSVYLGDFTPDTGSKKVYLITAEILSGDLIIAQSTTNFFVSDKSVAVLTGVNKEFLYETEDDAEVTVKIRDERVVDLIFTASSDDISLISRYAGKIEQIKTELENLGYIVNMSSVDTSYLSAKDTFAWIEYDHPNYNTQSPYTQHIVYEDNNIRMLGYTAVPYKDFLLVPDSNDSQKIFNFDIQRDSTDWHSMEGGGFLFNTVIEENLISGYYVLITQNGLKLYRLDKVNLTNFRNGTSGTVLQTFPFPNLYDEHHIKITVDGQTLSLWDGENPVISGYELPGVYGYGYGPITSHASHNCSQRSYFTFGNITMQTIVGEKLSDILENYNFESPDSRYVVNLSDGSADSFDTEDEIAEAAQKIVNKNITFIGLGNEENESQYQQLLELIANKGLYYDFAEQDSSDSMSGYIINSEESKRVKNPDDIIATDLVFTGTLYDGTVFTQSFDSLCVGETIEIKIPVEMTGLTSGREAVLLRNAALTYKDELGVGRTKNASDVTLPVISKDGKMLSQVSTDKPEYQPYQDVKIFDRIHNVSDIRTAKNLTNVITVLNSDGENVAEYEADLPEIMSGGFTERQEIWNTADCAGGEYTVRSEIYDSGFLVSDSAAILILTVPDVPQINLAGGLTLFGKEFDFKDTVKIDSSVENIGHADVVNAQTVIRITDAEDGTVVYEYTKPLNLAVSAIETDTLSVVPQTDFTVKKGKTYLVFYEAVLEDGTVIPLAGDGFILHKRIADII